MYVSTTIGYNSVGSNNDMITCSSGTQHKDYVPMGITYTDRIGSERSATLNSSYAYVGSAMNPYIELIGSDKNVINKVFTPDHLHVQMLVEVVMQITNSRQEIQMM